MKKCGYFCARRFGGLTLAVGVAMLILLLPVMAASSERAEPIQHYRMLSSVEYSGRTQFRHQIETQMTAERQSLRDNKVKYSVFSDDFSLTGSVAGSDGQPRSNGLFFVLDASTGYLSPVGRNLGLIESVNKSCAASVDKTANEYLNKTWKQTFHLSSIDGCLPREVRLTLTAIPVRTDTFGEMICVRALSEPFVVKSTNAKTGDGAIRARINAVYLFDSEVGEVYLSLSVFQAETAMNGFKEEIRYEVATYRTDGAGNAVDLSGLDWEFGSFASEVGLAEKSMMVEEQAPLPQWAQLEGLRAAQAANMCAAIACEGVPPDSVAAIYVPVSRIIEMQSQGAIDSMDTVGTIGGRLTANNVGSAGMRIAAKPKLTPKAAFVIGGGAAGIALATGGGGGGGSDARSPSTP